MSPGRPPQPSMGGAQGVVGRWAWLLAVAAVVTGAGQALELPVGQEWAVRTSLDLPLGRRQPQAPLFPRSFEVSRSGRFMPHTTMCQAAHSKDLKDASQVNRRLMVEAFPPWRRGAPRADLS